LVPVSQWLIYMQYFAEVPLPAFNTAIDGLSPGGEVQASARQVGPTAGQTSRKDLAEALRRTACGERAAFERVYRSTAAKLFGIVIRIVGRRDVAEHVLQDVYVRVWRDASEFDPRSGSPMAWMATIARNRALDEVASNTVARTLQDRPEVVELAVGEDQGPDHEGNEEERRLSVCLNRLEPEKRRALLRAYRYGMAREEIAQETDRPVATVKVWLRQSLAQLKDFLSQ